MTHGRRRCRNGDRCEPRTLAEAIACVVTHSAADARTIAERIGVRYGYLLDAANPDRDEVQFQARLIDPVSAAANNDAIVEFLCRLRGGVFVRVPSADLHAGEITQAHLDFITEVGKDAEKLRGILADRQITPEEFAAFGEKLDRTIQKALEWKAIVGAHVGKEIG